MTHTETAFRTHSAPQERRGVGRAWQALCVALAIHVVDEAATGFLAVYNPTVAAIRERVPWLPLQTFRFETWIAGLAIGIAALWLMSLFASRGAPWTRPVGYVLALVMTANALLHTIATVFGRTVGSIEFPRPMPGFYSSPLLFAASVYLLVQLRSSRPRRAQTGPVAG